MGIYEWVRIIPFEIRGILLVTGSLPVILYMFIKNILLMLVPNSYLHKDISGKVVLITGGAGGIGQAVAVRLAKKGARIISWDMNQKGNEETARIIQLNGGECVPYTVDISNKESIYSTALDVKADVGPVDILINNAGITGYTELIPKTKDTSFAKTMDVNFFSHTWTVNAFLPDMIAANSGHIVSISSLSGICSHHFIEYSSSKHAACGFMESLSLQLSMLGHSGIATTLICPSYIQTSLGCEFGDVPKVPLDYAAKKISDAILSETDFLIFPSVPKIMPLLKAITPNSILAKEYYYLQKTVDMNAT